jgi:hypothetical protein
MLRFAQQIGAEELARRKFSSTHTPTREIPREPPLLALSLLIPRGVLLSFSRGRPGPAGLRAPGLLIACIRFSARCGLP